MSAIWTMSVTISLIFALLGGNSSALAASALEGAPKAAEFVISAGALICLWSGIMNVLKRSGASAALARALAPVLRRLFPDASRDPAALEALTGNVSANLLGLGNAATPLGIEAARRMARGKSTASAELCLLVVINTASVQLLPTTVASVRAAAGAAAPFDILASVWIASALSVTAGILAAKALERIWRS